MPPLPAVAAGFDDRGCETVLVPQIATVCPAPTVSTIISTNVSRVAFLARPSRKDGAADK